MKIFDSKLGMNFENVSLLNLETIIVADFNIDYLSNDCNSLRLVKTLKSLSFTQLVASVTRPASGKCVDHIWSNKPQFLHKFKASTIDISILITCQSNIYVYLRVLRSLIDKSIVPSPTGI